MLCMRIVEEICLTPPASGDCVNWNSALDEVRVSIGKTVWPPGASDFAIYPESGKKRGEGNGVTPIKEGFLNHLEGYGWCTDERHNPLRMDAMRTFTNGWVGVEWETGNISSSHRSINRFLLANLQDHMFGGILVLPMRAMAQYLTDRIGNYEELVPYFPVLAGKASDWRGQGGVTLMGVQHDRTDTSVLRIAKGTDGRALS